MTGQTTEGDVTSGLHHCFSTAQECEEEIQEKQLNIMANVTEAGECLPLIEINRLEYQAPEEASKQKVETDPTVFRPPPSTSKTNKVKRIRISEIKQENICKYCKNCTCTCLNKCYSNCSSHFTTYS